MMTDEEFESFDRDQCKREINRLEQDLELMQSRCKELEMQLDYTRRRNEALNHQISALTLDIAFLDREKRGIGI